MSEQATTERHPDSAGAQLADLSNELVQLHKRNCGKGPIAARTHVSGDTLVCIMRGGLTQSEHTLRDAGHCESVEDGRRLLHEAMREDMIAAAERATGRRVISLMTATDCWEDLESAVFVLEPGAAAASRNGDGPA
jgi:uncharacterized protein YbcI